MPLAPSRKPFVGEWSKVLIDEQFRKAAGLLWVEARRPNGTIEGVAGGTAFFVMVPSSPDGLFNVVYAVTAAHVVHAARPFGPLHLRVNVKEEHAASLNAGYADLTIDPDAWIEHPTTDVAAAPMPSLNEKADWRTIPVSMVASDQYTAERRVGVGDEVFFVGLFSRLPGRSRFQPIIRFGNISMMPHEKVRIEIIRGVETMVDAYLIEARSWGGHSGSPAFIYYPPDRDAGTTGNYSFGGAAPALLGLISGHFPIPLQSALRDSLDSTAESANAGIAVVIPAQAILDILMDDEQVRIRKTLAKEWEKNQRSGVTMDTGLPEPPEAGDTMTRQDFYDGLRKIKKQPREKSQ
jgi:hypothetical protein